MALLTIRGITIQGLYVKKPRMVTIHPCMVFGPPLSPRHLRGSLSIIMMLVNRELPVLLPMQISIVDVRDVAEAHVRALTMGEDGGRYLTVAGEMMWSDISKILKKEFPERKWPFRQLSYLGYDTEITYQKLTQASINLHKGVPLVVSHQMSRF